MLWPHNSRPHVPWHPLSLLQCLLKDGIIPRKYTVPFYNYQRPWIGWLHKEISWPSLPHYPCTSQGSLPSVAQLWEWKTLLQGKKKKSSEVSLMWHRGVRTNTRLLFHVRLLMFYQDVCNGGSGLEEEFWLCPEGRWWFWHSILLHLNKNKKNF